MFKRSCKISCQIAFPSTSSIRLVRTAPSLPQRENADLRVPLRSGTERIQVHQKSPECNFKVEKMAIGGGGTDRGGSFSKKIRKWLGKWSKTNEQRHSGGILRAKQFLTKNGFETQEHSFPTVHTSFELM